MAGEQGFSSAIMSWNVQQQIKSSVNTTLDGIIYI